MKQQGVTLIQMLFAVALLTALTQLGVPAYSQMSQTLQQQAAAEDLGQALRMARNEALMRNQVVNLEALAGNWRNGWRMTLGEEGNTLLRERQAQAQVTIVGKQSVARRVRFTALGIPLQVGGAFQAGTLFICEGSGPRSAYQVVLARTGRISVRQVADEEPLCRAANSQQ